MKYTTGQCMRFYRKRAKLKLYEVEANTDVSQRVLSAWERDESIPDIFNFRVLTILYNTTVEELLGEVQPQLDEDNRYLGYKEVAKELGVSKSSIWKWYKEANGEIRAEFTKEKGTLLYHVGDFKKYFYLSVKRG